MRLIGFAIYLGIGAMLHALFIGPQFDWSSAWTFGWLFGWPIMIVITSWVALIGALVVGGIAWSLWASFDTFCHWLDGRKRRKATR